MHEVFSQLISRKDDSKEKINKRLGYVHWFCDTFPIKEFSKEEYIFRTFLEYCVKLEIPVRYKYLEVFLSLELRQILQKNHIHVSGTEGISFDDPAGLESAISVTKNVMCDIYLELEEIEDNLDDFIVSADTFMVQRLNERLSEILTTTYEMTSSSTEDAAEYALDNISEVRTIYDRDLLDELNDRCTSDTDYEFLCDCGLPFIDSDLGGLYTTQLGGVEAQPGTGKTRFVLGTWVYRASTIYKKNVVFFALEQDKREIEAILVARHVFQLFNAQVDSKLILRNQVPENCKEMVETAKLDLFESGKYGKIHIESTVLYLESFLQKIKTIDRLHGPFDLIAIDYMGLIEQEPTDGVKYRVNLQDYQVIGRAFKWFKRYLRASRKSGIAISQFNNKGITAGTDDKLITTDMAQGGIEVYRNTDWNIAISMTPEMKLQQVRRFSQPKVRDSGGFGRVLTNTRLGFAYFYPKEQTKI